MTDKAKNTEFLQTILDANPAAVFVVDEDFHVVALNKAAEQLADGQPQSALAQPGGVVLRCIHATETPEGCGKTPECQSCVIRDAVSRAAIGNRVHRVRTRLTRIRNGKQENAFFLVTASRFEHEGEVRVLLVVEDISEFMELRELIPICARCKKIRRDDNYWDIVEKYMQTHMDLTFTHSYCPECEAELLAEAGKRHGSDG